MSVKRTCAISSVRLEPESDVRLGLECASDINVASYVSILAQATMPRNSWTVTFRQETYQDDSRRQRPFKACNRDVPGRRVFMSRWRRGAGTPRSRWMYSRVTRQVPVAGQKRRSGKLRLQRAASLGRITRKSQTYP